MKHEFRSGSIQPGDLEGFLAWRAGLACVIRAGCAAERSAEPGNRLASLFPREQKPLCCSRTRQGRGLKRKRAASSYLDFKQARIWLNANPKNRVGLALAVMQGHVNVNIDTVLPVPLDAFLPRILSCRKSYCIVVCFCCPNLSGVTR